MGVSVLIDILVEEDVLLAVAGEDVVDVAYLHIQNVMGSSLLVGVAVVVYFFVIAEVCSPLLMRTRHWSCW